MCSWQVFQYQWHDQPITYDVMLVLLSFILAWGEAWFFDFRMVSIEQASLLHHSEENTHSDNTSQIPLETKAKEIWGAAPQRPNYSEDERTPLLAGGGEGGMLARYPLSLHYRKESSLETNLSSSNFHRSKL